MQKIGRLLSTIVSQNIAILIAIGLIRAIFGLYGWFPNDNVILLSGPLLNWLVPTMLAYSGGHLIGGKRGGAAAALVVFSLALASTVSMIFMAFVLGPLVGWTVNRIEKWLENRLPSGFELLTANFISAVVAGVLAVFCFMYVGQAISSIIRQFHDLIVEVAYSGWLPLSALLIEPAKVLFLNNVMSYGIFGPLGISQAKDLSKSVFFLLESNPGPGIGLLLAFVIRLRAKARRNAASTLGIHALGGIHEVYFPYVLMRPVLLIPLIAGSMAGISVFQFFNAGAVSIPSPASLFLIIGLTPPDDIVYVLLGIAVSAGISLLLSLAIIRSMEVIPEQAMQTREHDVLQRLVHVQQWNEVKQMLRPIAKIETRNKDVPAEDQTPSVSGAGVDAGEPYIVCFACDAGMGSSAMGAAMLRKKLRQSPLEARVTVVHSSLDQIPPNASLIVTHHYLMSRAVKHAPGKQYIALDNYTDPAGYEEIMQLLGEQLIKP
jgi:PTS system mannitol-specific IIC component